MEHIKVVVKEPGKMPEVRMVEPTLETWQGLVGGYIELAFVGAGDAPDIPMFINGEGKLEGLPPNVSYSSVDYVAGTLVAFAEDGEGGERSLTDEEVEQAMKWLTDNHIVSV